MLLGRRLFFAFGLLSSWPLAAPHSSQRQSVSVQNLPIFAHTPFSPHSRLSSRADLVTAAGLGDWVDVTYTVLVTVGPVQTTLVLDTGSSDLWLLSDACVNACVRPAAPVFPLASLAPANLDARLFYGDSSTGKHAFGAIGTTTVSIAALELSDQFLAAINDTDTTIAATGAVGILGLGFPVASTIFATVFKARFSECSTCTSRRRTVGGVPPEYQERRIHTYGGRRRFPILPSLLATSHLSRRDNDTAHSTTFNLLSLIPEASPLIPRAISMSEFQQPVISITLQRDTVEVGGNVGQLTLGGLPGGVSIESLTWATVRQYTAAQGGLPPSLDNPDESFPLAWEIPLDAVYLDGNRLPNTNLTQNGISITALVDTGNSLIRGPADVLNMISQAVSPTPLLGDMQPSMTSDCSPHTLAFQIGGQMFPVDPRDLVSQDVAGAVGSDSASCVLNLAITDPPELGNGYLYTWSLGVPFLKSVLTAFHYGNITHPSSDLPRIGFLSTVPSDASDNLRAAVQRASAAGGDLPTFSESAPTGTHISAGNGIGNVPLAPTDTSLLSPSLSSEPRVNASPGSRTPWLWLYPFPFVIVAGFIV